MPTSIPTGKYPKSFDASKWFSIYSINFSLDPLPPGCLTITCAHARAPEFYAESVYPGNENNFLGVKCGSLSALNGNFCPGKKFAMGYAVPKNLKGNYFLKTNDKSPFGENATRNVTPTCVGGGGGVDGETVDEIITTTTTLLLSDGNSSLSTETNNQTDTSTASSTEATNTTDTPLWLLCSTLLMLMFSFVFERT